MLMEIHRIFRRTNSEMDDNEIHDRREGNAEADAEYGRKSVERRGWKFGLIFRANESFRLIESWLEENCRHQWGLMLEDMDDNVSALSYKVMFDDEEDKQAFMK